MLVLELRGGENAWWTQVTGREAYRPFNAYHRGFNSGKSIERTHDISLCHDDGKETASITLYAEDGSMADFDIDPSKLDWKY